MAKPKQPITKRQRYWLNHIPVADALSALRRPVHHRAETGAADPEEPGQPWHAAHIAISKYADGLPLYR